LVCGCDPKADSPGYLAGRIGERQVLDTLREEGEDVELDKSPQGRITVNNFVSNPAEPAAGESAVPDADYFTAINLMEHWRVRKQMSRWINVFYDVLGDVVCGGFAMRCGKEKPGNIYRFVGEMMACIAANILCKRYRKFADAGSVRLGGLIATARMVDNETVQ